VEIGLFTEFEWRPGVDEAQAFDDSLAQVMAAEDLGYDAVWLAELHFQKERSVLSSPLVVGAAIAGRTKRVKIGFAVQVLPLIHPLRLAEDVALLDVMSKGRITLGIAIGYKPDEFALYGVELEKRGARFEEQLAIMKGLWTQERVSFTGACYTVEGRLEPKPVTKPHPPVWIGGWGDITLKRAATLADNWIPGPTADLKRLLEGKKRFLDNRRAAGRTEPITEWPLTRDVIIADTDREARALAEKHIMISYRKEYAGGWRHPFIDASVVTDLDALMKNRFLIGGPDQVVRALKPFVTEYGVTHLICRVFFPGMPHRHIMRELELIAQEVRPAFA